MSPSFILGPRLNTILELVKQVQQHNLHTPYPYIWDCCCDHGYLGVKILKENLCEKLIFVDQVAHIMNQLEARLAPFSTGKHVLITADAGDLCFDPMLRHLVILAGVGGESIVDIVQSIERKHPNVQIDYLFCPSASQSSLRQYLISEGYHLLFEKIACEKKRYYEILFVQRKIAGGEINKIPLISTLWDTDNPGHQKHLRKMARHEQLKVNGVNKG